MDYSQYLKLKRDIENEYRKNLEALELIWKRSKNLLSPSNSQANGNNATTEIDRNLADAVRGVISQISKDFSANEIERGLLDHNYDDGKHVNRVALTNTLHRLFRRGEIELVQKGRGRISSVYRQKVSS